MPFLSFIIPCYNAQNTIRSTVESVLNQTDNDFEILLINDGSTDNTLDISNSLALGNDSIVIINKSNGGVSSARNTGVQHAQGDYIAFLDSDDLFEPNLIEKMKEFLGADMVLFGWVHERNFNKGYENIPHASSLRISDFLLSKIKIHVCSFIVRRNFLIENKIFFTEGTHYSEDIEFIIKCLHYSPNVAYCTDVLFTYKYCPTSVMHSAIYTDRRITSVYAMERVFNLLKSTSHATSALIALKLTIILHQKMILRMHNENDTISNILDNYGKKYLTKHTPFASDSHSAYVWLMSILYKFPSLYRFVLRIF